MRLVRDGWQIQVEVVVTFLVNFRAHLNIFVHYQCEDSHAH